LNQNHYHFILQQASDRGIEKFMQRLGTGYTMYFNSKQERSGALFQGRFKAAHINSNAYLLHVSAYVNLNNRVHQLRGSTSQSSWAEYIGKRKGVGICEKEVILGQFRKPEEYIAFAEDSLQGILERRGLLESSLLLE
jgi:putative transposase